MEGGLRQNMEISSKSSMEHKQQEISQNLIYFLGGTFFLTTPGGPS